jgi:hypothetical protein
MRLILEVDAGVAHALRQAPVDAALPAGVAALQRVVARLGVRLQPMHPTSADAALTRYFFIDGVDTGALEATVAELRRCVAVTAAYAKPADEAP